MTAGWNFERRRDTCARFILGVSVLTKGLADRDTSLEAVRSRMRLSPEEALFAARRLHDEHLLVFGGGPVKSTAAGIARAASVKEGVRAKVRRFDEVVKLLRAAGTPLAVVAGVIGADGEALVCGAPDDEAEGEYRLVVIDEVVTLERRTADGTFETVQP
jgi:hypothetical protein